MLPHILMLLDFAASVSVVVVTPPSRYLTLIGPATTLYVLPGPTTFSYVLRGPEISHVFTD